MANSPNLPQSYYSNPAFCQKSEFGNYTNNGSPASRPSTRQSPVGAQAPVHYVEVPPCDEQEFYEEMLVDESGVVKQKKFLVLQSSPQRSQKSRYEYIPMQEPCSPSQSPPHVHRYALIDTDEDPHYEPKEHRYEHLSNASLRSKYSYASQPKVYSYSTPKKCNPHATRRLHELISTPNSVPKSRRGLTYSPQKHVNTAIATQMYHPEHTKSQILTSPCKSDRPPLQATLVIAAAMMLLCGSVTSTLCFYMVSIMGRLYFLDFGTISGFTCVILGLLGFRTRNCYWLPNRNFISGYLVLSVFSLLTCAGLLVLLLLKPRPGTPLADMTSGAVCGISVLSLILASAGVIASYCCKYPPPDNRVEHCAQGFTV